MKFLVAKSALTVTNFLVVKKFLAIRQCLVLAGLLLSMAVQASVSVVDDTGTKVMLESPPQRIVSLSPHLTELLFSLGVGDRVTATVDHSDYPEQATGIPRLGNAFSVSVEAVIAQSPGLVVAWMTGGNHRTFEQLRSLGYPVYVNEAENLEGIARTVEQLGLLVGKEELGRALAKDFLDGLEAIRQSRTGKKKTRVFFQISDTQLFTVNGKHLIGQAITTCGAENVFEDIGLTVPMVSFESVVERNPDVLVVASPYPGFKSSWDDHWKSLGWESRVRSIDASLITRPSLRMLEGVKILCGTLDS